MKIGHFTKTEDGAFEGRIQTLTLTADIRYVPATDKPNQDMPDFRIYLVDSDVEIGAAWHAMSKEDKPYLKSKIDDPGLYDTIWPVLTRDDGGDYSLYWDRPKPRNSETKQAQSEKL